VNLDRYPYFATNDFQDYSFFSEGPKGRIKKTVSYTRMSDAPVVYNLAFGDEDLHTGKVNDTVITNNNDRDIVLSTVAITIIAFCERYGNHFIYATGSTAVRTRLYQMSIAGLWDKIKVDFEVYGFRNNDWHEFEKNVNYEAFLVRRK